jgi:MarR family transcriptional regulator, 2-MHQ and catechol-resistance regulon repressor
MNSRAQKITAPHLWTVMTHSYRAVQTLTEATIACTDLCPTDFAAEARLHKGPLTITEIQNKVLLASGSITAAVDRLENRGLLVRKSTLSDRQARVLELTREGRRSIAVSFVHFMPGSH